MSTVLNQSLGDYCSLASVISNSTTTWRFEARFKIDLDAEDQEVNCMRWSSNFYKTGLTIEVDSTRSRDWVSLRLNDSAYNFYGTNYAATINDGEYHEVTIIGDGTTAYCYIDGDLISSTSCSDSISNIDTIGSSSHLAGEDAGYLERFAIYESTDRSIPWRIWDASNSDTSNTGAQPILIESVAGDNATGVNFPTDGTAFETDSEVDDIPIPMLAVSAEDQALSSTTEFDAITIEGVESATDIAISISGGSYRVSTDGSTWGAYSTNASTVQEGYLVQVAVDNSDTEGVASTAEVTVGSVTYTFNATTVLLDSLVFDQALLQPSTTLTFTSEMLDGTTVTVTDDTNSIELENLVNNGDGTYSVDGHSCTELGLTVGDVSVFMTNDVGTSTQTATLEYAAPDGYTQIVAIEQSSMLSSEHWGFERDVQVGQIFWALDVEGYDYINNGLGIPDPTFTGGVVGGLLQDPDTLIFTEIWITLAVNDGTNSPTVSDQAFSATTSSDIGGIIGSVVATDIDGDTLTYSTTSTNIAFADPASPEMTWLIQPSAGEYNESITVSDGTYSDTATVTVTVSEAVVNSGPAISDQQFTIDDSYVAGDSVGTVTASDADSDTLSYTISGSDLAIDSATGELTLVSDATEGSLTATVTVSDGTDTETATITVTVDAVAIDSQAVITATTTVNLTVGDTWTESDLDYSADNGEGGDVTDDVVVSGDTVDTGTANTYTLYLDVLDADQVTVTVIVTEAVVEEEPEEETTTGITGIVGTVNAGAQFDINLNGVDPLADGESWKGYIQVSGRFYALTINTVTDSVVTVTAANDTPTAALGGPTLILQRVQSL